jgi:hypothetical protein
MPRSRLDPEQREHELADAMLTLLIAVSRYGSGDKRPRPTAKRLATLEQVTALVAAGVGERIRAVRGKKTAANVRQGWRRQCFRI